MRELETAAGTDRKGGGGGRMLHFFFLGFVRIHILHHACEEPVYGTGIQEELARHGYRLSPGTLYPILHGLEERGYLESRSEVVDGKVRKYYLATTQGREALAKTKEKIRELVEEVLDGNRGRPHLDPPAAAAARAERHKD